MCDLSVIVATKNSASYIDKTLKALEKDVFQHVPEAELIVVNDGGDIDLKQRVLNFKRLFNKIIYVSLKKSYGQQMAVRAGISVANGRYLVTFDDDLQYQTSDILRLLQHIKANPDLKIVCGYSPVKKHHGIYGKLSALTVYILENIFFRKYRNTHYLTSFKIFERSVIYSSDNERNIYFFWDFQPEEIGYIKVQHHPRVAGRSGYTLCLYLKFFLHIILKIIQKITLASIIIWTISALFLFSLKVMFTVILFLIFVFTISNFYLNYLKRQSAVIDEVIA